MTRTFAAIPIPPDIAGELIGSASQLPGDQPRWVDASTAHLTLAFLGSLSDADVAAVVRSLAEVREEPFDMQLATADAFPSPKSPRVVVVEPSAASELRRLYEAVHSTLTDWLPEYRRRFRPHVTLARVKGSRDIDTSNIIRTIGMHLPRTVAVRKFVLYKSRTEPDRAYYDIVEAFKLGN